MAMCNSNCERLFLHEELTLLMLHDDKGTMLTDSMNATHALAGAILAELMLHQSIGIHAYKRGTLVNVINDEPIGEQVADECLERIATAKKRTSLMVWIQRIAGKAKLLHRVAQGLCDLRILEDTEDKVLWIFPRRVFLEADPGPEDELINRLHQAIFTDNTTVDERTAILISIAHNANILQIPFDKKELKARKDRIDAIINDDVIGTSIRESIEAIQAAVIAACVSTTIIH